VTFSVPPILSTLYDFSEAPLIGGEPGTVDPSSPFHPPTTTGSSVTFHLPEPGFFPYYAGGRLEDVVAAIIVDP
jgi:hypothetical protein